MTYHDCFDSFVCFWLPVTMIYNRHKHYQQHRHLIKKWISNTCSPMFPQPLFPDATAGQFFAFRWYSHLGKDDNIATVEFQIRKAKPEKLCHSEWQNNRIVSQCSACLLLGHSHILQNEWLGKWGLAQAQRLVHTTNRTQEGISIFFGKSWLEFCNVALTPF